MSLTLKVEVIPAPLTPPPPAGVRVELDYETALAIIAISMKTGGSPEGFRGKFEKLGIKLAETLGIDRYRLEKLPIKLTGSVRFDP